MRTRHMGVPSWFRLASVGPGRPRRSSGGVLRLAPPGASWLWLALGWLRVVDGRLRDGYNFLWLFPLG